MHNDDGGGMVAVAGVEVAVSICAQQLLLYPSPPVEFTTWYGGKFLRNFDLLSVYRAGIRILAGLRCHLAPSVRLVYHLVRGEISEENYDLCRC